MHAGELLENVLLPEDGPLDPFVVAVGEILESQFDPSDSLARLTALVGESIPHDYVDCALVDESRGGLVSLQETASLPERERPSHPYALEGSLIGGIIESGRVALVRDLQDDGLIDLLSPRERGLVRRLGLRSCLVLPLWLRTQPRGVLEIWSATSHAFSIGQVAVARRIADRVAPVAEIIGLYRSELGARRQLATLMEIAHTVSASLDLDEVLRLVARTLTETLDLPSCAIYLRDEQRNVLVPRIAHSRSLPASVDQAALEEAFQQNEFPIGVLGPGHVWHGGRPNVIDDPASHPWFTEDFLRAVPLVAAMEVPLVVRDRLLGLAALPLWERGRSFSEWQLRLAHGIGQSAAVAIEHGQLYSRARELGQVEERNRLAREVHDTLAQGLTAIALQLESAERLLPPDTDARILVAETRTLARRSLDEARRAVWGLAPSSLEGRTLPKALEQELSSFGRRTGIQTAFVLAEGISNLAEERAAALLRVTQEALHNVEKHAQAPRVRVQLEPRTDSEEVVLLVADDGDGFDVAGTQPSPEGGFGLTSMRERLRAVGGTLEIESAPGWGTRVRACVPAGPREAAASVTDAAAPSPIRVLVVDDHPLARQGIRQLLDGVADVVVVGEAADGREALDLAQALRPDVVLMDLRMPNMGGSEATRELRDRHPDINVLILTTFAREQDLFEALRAGARGYLLKDASVEDLATAIRTVHEGGSLVEPAMASRLIDRFGELVQRGQLTEHLTEREMEVLAVLATGARNREIADRLSVTEKTVKYHLGQLYAKLDVTGRAEAVTRARALGLVPAEDRLPA